MDITEVVKRTGVPAHTLRFYAKKGLITSISPPGASPSVWRGGD